MNLFQFFFKKHLLKCIEKNHLLLLEIYALKKILDVCFDLNTGTFISPVH